MAAVVRTAPETETATAAGSADRNSQMSAPEPSKQSAGEKWSARDVSTVSPTSMSRSGISRTGCPNSALRKGRIPHMPAASRQRRPGRCLWLFSFLASLFLQVLEPGRPDVERVPVRRLRGLFLDIGRKVDAGEHLLMKMGVYLVFEAPDDIGHPASLLPVRYGPQERALHLGGLESKTSAT